MLPVPDDELVERILARAVKAARVEQLERRALPSDRSLQRIALRTRSWFAVGTSQLAAGAAGSIMPGGGAAATALQFRLLVRAGVAPSRVAGRWR